MNGSTAVYYGTSQNRVFKDFLDFDLNHIILSRDLEGQGCSSKWTS